MERLFDLILVLTFVVVLAVCGNGSRSGSDDKKITVGASLIPHAEVLGRVKSLLEEKGCGLDIRTINDYITPNKLLDKGETDASYLQHTPYLNAEKKDKGYKIVSAGNVHLEPMAVYSKKYKSLKGLPRGATVYMSNNPAEQGRFLKLFVDAGLVKIKEGVKIEDAESSSITENKKDVRPSNKQSAEFSPKTYQDEDADAVIINSDFTAERRLNPKKDSITVESTKDNPHANLTTVRGGRQDNKKIKALIEVLQPKDIQDLINEKYSGAVVPAR